MDKSEYTHEAGFSIKDPFGSTVRDVYIRLKLYMNSHIRGSDRESLLTGFNFYARDRDASKTTLCFFDIAETRGKIGPEKLDLLRSCLSEQKNKACVNAIDTYRAFVISKEHDDVDSFVRDTKGSEALRDAREQERQRKERQSAMAKRKREREEARMVEKRKKWAKERLDADRRVANARRGALSVLELGAKALAPKGSDDDPPSGDLAYIVMKREVSEQLDSSDRATIMMHSGLSQSAKEKIRTALVLGLSPTDELFSAMESKEKLSSRDVHILKISLENRNVPAYRLVEAYETAYIK